MLHGPAVTRPSSPEEARGEQAADASLERGTISAAAAAATASAGAKKKRKMPIINPLVTLPMWPSKCLFARSSAPLACLALRRALRNV